MTEDRSKLLVKSTTIADGEHQSTDTPAEPWRPAPGERVIVRDHVPGWAGQAGTVKAVGPRSLPRPVKVRLDDEDERDFALDELAPANNR
jgi:hypothetical protein